MAHAHNVWDVDPHFVVDAENRTILDQSPVGTTLMQYDHNSERLTFEAPLMVDEHDMSECDKVEIHFINIGSNGKRNADIYPVEDLKIKADDATKVEFTWLVSDKATLYAGSLSFVLRFICETDGKEAYRWNSAICNSINIGNGIDNRDSVATQYSDLLASWYAQFLASGNKFITDVEAAANNKLQEIEAAGEEVVTKVLTEEIGPEVRNYVDTNIIPEINTAKTEALTSIDSSKNESLNAIDTEKTEATTEINTAKTEALTSITTQADDIIHIVLSRLPIAEEASF